MTDPAPPTDPGSPRPTGPTAGPARRGRWVLLLVLAAAAVGGVSRPTWAVGQVGAVLHDVVAVPVAGAIAAPQTGAAALVLLAAAGAVALVGRVGRGVVAAVTAGAGVLVVAAGLTVLRDPGAAVAATLADATGVTGGEPDARATAAPVVAVVLGAVVVVLAVLLARARGGWQQRSRRHERPTVQGRDVAPAPPGDERADWDALSRGDDPS